jgi:RNA polymerase sigma factor for flagellar operon FliA
MKASKEELDALWSTYNEFKDQESKDDIVRAYLPLVRKIASKVYKKIPNHVVEFEDLVNVGSMGLCQSLESYDETRKVLFRTFCQPRILGSMIDLLRNWDWIPQSARRHEIKLKGVRRDLAEKLLRPPTKLELAVAMGMTLTEFLEYEDLYTIGLMVASGGEPVDEQWMWRHTEDLPPSESSTTPEGIDLIWNQIEEFIWPKLNKKQRDLIEDYYFKGKNMKLMAEERGVTESAVSIAHNSIITSLANLLEPSMLI